MKEEDSRRSAWVSWTQRMSEEVRREERQRSLPWAWEAWEKIKSPKAPWELYEVALRLMLLKLVG